MLALCVFFIAFWQIRSKKTAPLSVFNQSLVVRAHNKIRNQMILSEWIWYWCVAQFVYVWPRRKEQKWHQIAEPTNALDRVIKKFIAFVLVEPLWLYINMCECLYVCVSQVNDTPTNCGEMAKIFYTKTKRENQKDEIHKSRIANVDWWKNKWNFRQIKLWMSFNQMKWL